MIWATRLHAASTVELTVSSAQVLGDLQELGVELLAVSGDPRERAESFVRLIKPAGRH
jgi:hypothetical protein